MAPCDHYTFEECLDRLGITDPTSSDAVLLCTEKDFFVEHISAATIAIIIYLFTNLYIQIVECSLVLKNSQIWGRRRRGSNVNEEGDSNNHYEEGKQAIFYSSVINCLIGLLLYVSTTIGINILSNPLDDRANNIVVGLSQLFSGVIFCITSICIPQWFGIYHSSKITKISFTSSKEIAFNLSWNLWKQLLSMFFFNLYFSSANASTGRDLSVLYGAIIGVPCAFLCIYITILARSKKYKIYKRKLALVMVLVFGVASWYTVYSGIHFINEVWLPDTDDNVIRALISFGYSIIWIVVLIASHLILYFWTQDKQLKGTGNDGQGGDGRGSGSGIGVRRITTRFTSQLFNSKPLQYFKTKSIIETNEKEEPGDDNDNENDEEEGCNNYADVKDKPETFKEGIDNNNNKNTTTAGDDDDDDIDSPPSPSPPDKEGQEDDEKPRRTSRTTVVGFDVQDQDQDVESSLYVEPKNAPSHWKLFMTKLVDTFPFICVININASYEQCAAKNALPLTFELLYPADYNTGTMCAWDSNSKPGPNSTIKQFDTAQAVYDANYEIIHCGACGACSNWDDIQLQYTTRKVLSAIGKVCAKKSIGKKFNSSDDNDLVVQCNHLQLGFTMPCAKAWAWDEVHTKNAAIFTYLQAHLSKTFTDMKVTIQDITMATIDEALSGPTFVPEVGATRRRMNIISDIKRPVTQQCKVATQNWTEVFNDTFYPPVGGTYTVQLPGKPSEEVVVIGQDSSSS